MAAKKKDKKGKTIRIRQVRSAIGTRRPHREVLRTLGLRRIRDEVVRLDTPAVRGAIAKIPYLVEVVPGSVGSPAAPAAPAAAAAAGSPAAPTAEEKS